MRRRHKPLPPPPDYDPHGYWIKDPYSGAEDFVSHEAVQYACRMNIEDYERVGYDWRKDPTYNLRRKK